MNTKYLALNPQAIHLRKNRLDKRTRQHYRQLEGGDLA